MDPINGAPQKWAQNCFYMCTYAVMMQCIFAVTIPLVVGGSVKKGDKGEGDVEYEVNHKMLGTCLIVFRWIGITVKELTGWEWHFITNAMENAKGTLAFCPMLSILFVATRMRAMTLTNWKGAPQGWAQDGMYMATWAILLQFLMVLLIPVCTLVMEGKASHPELDEDGNVKFKPEGKIALIVVEIIRWLAFGLLYGGTITVMVGIWTMTPENA